MDRTGARAAAMKLLYEWEMGGDGGEDTRMGLLEITPGENESDYMDHLVQGVVEHVNELDRQIEKYAVGWSLDRITRVDLTILRIATYEISRGEVPGGVAVNEAVELAKQYSTDKAGGFVNGILGNIQREAAR